MGFLDRFKKEKEKDLGSKTASTIVADEKKIESKSKEKVEKKIETKKEKTSKPSKTIPETLANVLLRPLVTEKTATLTSAGQYVFEINPQANKVEVAAAVKAIYGVAPVKVQTQKVRSEPVRFGRFHGKKKAWKKAIVCLPKGKTINVHESI
ncbi:MAG: 50S ribosomal protein L23 [Candidatus Uhrbacteria bacterium]